MIEQLNKLISDETLTAIYTEEDPDRCATGNIIAVDEDYVLSRDYRPTGLFDGYTATKTDTITRVGTQTQDIERTQTLKDFKKSNKVFEINLKKGPLLGLLDYVIENRVFVEVCIDESYEATNIHGYINSLENDCLTIQQANYYGEQDGTATIRVMDIVEMFAGDTRGSDVDILFNLAQNPKDI